MAELATLFAFLLWFAIGVALFAAFYALEEALVDYQADKPLPAVPRRAGVVVRVVRG